METTNNKLYEFIFDEAAELFSSTYENKQEGNEDAEKMAKSLSNSPNFESIYAKIRKAQTETINKFPEKLNLLTDLYISIIELVEFAEAYYKNLAYLKSPELAFENTIQYFYFSGLRPERTDSKI